MSCALGRMKSVHLATLLLACLQLAPCAGLHLRGLHDAVRYGCRQSPIRAYLPFPPRAALLGSQCVCIPLVTLQTAHVRTTIMRPVCIIAVKSELVWVYLSCIGGPKTLSSMGLPCSSSVVALPHRKRKSDTAAPVLKLTWRACAVQRWLTYCAAAGGYCACRCECSQRCNRSSGSRRAVGSCARDWAGNCKHWQRYATSLCSRQQQLQRLCAGTAECEFGARADNSALISHRVVQHIGIAQAWCPVRASFPLLAAEFIRVGVCVASPTELPHAPGRPF